MLSNCVGHNNYIRHLYCRPNGPNSSWYAHVSDEKIVYTYETNEDVFETITFETLDDFVSAHYEAEGVIPEHLNAWEECETCVYGTWKPLEEMRVSHLQTKSRQRLVGDLL